MKKIATSLASLALAAAGVVGLGAGTAHADGGCSAYVPSNYHAHYQVCLYIVGDDAHLTWAANPTGSSTDERFFVVLHSYCGDLYSTNWNDWTQPDMEYGSILSSCGKGGMWAELHPTESGRQSGPYVYA